MILMKWPEYFPENCPPLEVYEFYDKPVLFACRNASDNIFLGVLATEEDEFETWLYVSLSRRRFTQVRADTIDLHDAFALAEDGIAFEVQIPLVDDSSVSVKRLPTDSMKLAS